MPLWKPAIPATAAVLLGVSTTLPGCANTGSMPPAPERQVVSALPPAPAALPEYRVQIGDVLAVKFLLTPELNEEVTVRPDGKVSTAVAEEVVALGRSAPEIAADLREMYSKELRNPRLTVVVKTFVPTRVFVAGEVNAPGELTNVGPPLSLLQAISRAGGLKLSGSSERVFLIRRGVDDAPAAFATRYQDVISGRDPRADIRLAPYDVVYVPRTGIAEAYFIWNQYVQQFVPVSWGFSYLVNQSSGGSTVVSGGSTAR